MISYIESSIVARIVLQQVPFLPDWRTWPGPTTSRLTCVETRRALRRLRSEGVLDDASLALGMRQLEEMESGLSLVDIDEPILDRAGDDFPGPVRSLDAIHLATALRLRELDAEMLFASHDRRLAHVASLLGFQVLGI